MPILYQATGHPLYMDKFPPEVIKVDERVVVDGRVVTSRAHGTTMEFALTFVELLYGKQKAEEVAGPMVWLPPFIVQNFSGNVFKKPVKCPIN